MRVFLVVALFLFLGCAGCVEEAPEPIAPEVIVAPATNSTVNVTVPPPEPAVWRPSVLASLGEMLPFEALSADGTMLRGHVYLPNGTGPFATILGMSPYWNTNYRQSDNMAVPAEDGRTTMWRWLGPYMDAGFAVAIVNLRGFGLSDGCMDLGGPNDTADVRAVTDALAAQDWSNGNVGMVGHSFDAWMQYSALKDPSPALKALVPVSGVIDTLSLTGRNGAIAVLGPAISTVVFALSAGAPAGLAQDPQFFSPLDAGHVACADGPSHHAEHVMQYTHGDRTPYWQARDYRDALATAGVPILVFNGLAQNEGHILQADGVWERAPEGSRVVLGQWGHGYPPEDIRFEGNATYAETAVAWMHHHLRGGPSPPTGFVEFQADDTAWHTADAWPPTTQETVLHFGDGTLGLAEAPPATQQFLADDQEPAPSCSDARAVYVSPPLAEDVVLAGYFHAELTLSSTLPDSNLAVYLYHGEAGACGGGDATEVRRALTDLAHRGHLDQGIDFPVGTPDKVVVRSHPLASHVPAGDHLIVVVAGGSDEVAPDPMNPLITVHAGASQLRVPVLRGELVFAS